MKLGLLLIGLLLCANVKADLRGSPFQPEIDNRFNELVGDSAFQSRSGYKAKQLAVGVYDYSVLGGTSAVGDFDTGADLPANAIITRSWIYVSNAVTSTVDTGNNAELFGFICVPDDTNAPNETLFTAANLSRRTPSSYYAVEAVSTGASTVFQRVEAKCNIKARITQANVTAGKVHMYVEYVLHQ